METENFVLQKGKPDFLTFSIGEDIPKTLRGNFLYLKQTLLGIIGNTIDLHPDSSLEIKISAKDLSEGSLSVHRIPGC
ncbi:MAG: hypothetical protein ACI8P3_001173 [Saprospiraceae bacterium]|jgi:hypothetical protein